MGDEVLLEMRNINKSFPGVKALDGVDLKVRRGEVHAILGENGAGKSTLMKILSGAYEKDSGDIYLDGEPVEINDPHESQNLGIAMIYQEFNLAPQLSVSANVFIGREPRSPFFHIIDADAIRSEVKKILKRLDIDIDVDRKVKYLNICQQQITEIAKALSIESKLFIMDEPTSALMESEVETLFKIIHQLKKAGMGIIYISHDMEEVFSISDTITVMRDGKRIDTRPTSDFTPHEAVKMMVGREITQLYTRRPDTSGEVLLEVSRLSTKNFLHDISFTLKRGEVLGLSGLLGAGRTELARAIFGADPITGGKILVEGKKIGANSIPRAIAGGIGFVPEDRRRQGLFIHKTVMQNISAPNIHLVSSRGLLNTKRERELSRKYVREMGIKTTGIDQVVAHLSGGNQQKVVLTKWLARNPKILILDDPTRGIDVGAKQSIYTLIGELASEGMGIIFISSELPEVLGVSDRVLVMAGGRVRGELQRDEATQERVMQLSTMC